MRLIKLQLSMYAHIGAQVRFTWSRTDHPCMRKHSCSVGCVLHHRARARRSLLVPVICRASLVQFHVASCLQVGTQRIHALHNTSPSR